MARILGLATSGFGKTTSLGKNPILGIEGLDPKKTFIISCTNKGLPFPGWKNQYKPVQPDPTNASVVIGNYLVTTDSETIFKWVNYFIKNRPEIENYVLDDSNYNMQDYYMLNGKKSAGYNIFKEIGYNMAVIFKAADLIDNSNKNFIMLAHYESYSEDDVTKYRMKTVGKMTQDYITPEGKFEIVLVGHQEFDEQTKSVKKFFVTNFDGKYDVAKSPYGMFEDLHIPNDMGYVLKKINDYENGIV